jgi:molecular chaperone GrpE
MMPDKNHPSDSALNDSVDELVQDTATADVAGSPADTDAPTGTSAGSDPRTAHDQAGSQANGAGAQSDPLGFGDQRMGDVSESGDGERTDEITQLRAQLAAAENRAAENWDRLLRLQAEMENQRKRAQNDVNKARKFALEGIVSDLLPVKDSLEMGLAAAQAEDADPKAIIEGADLTLKMLAQVFEKNNIVEVNPVDEKFDPEFHQAMSMQEIEGKAANTVASVMQKGYTLNERLVRPALVMVAK